MNGTKTTLIVGGSSGIGLELARRFRALGDRVIVTGRHDPHEPGVEYRRLKLDGMEYMLQLRIQRFVHRLPQVHTLVYAAGFLQRGTIDQLSPRQIREMMNVKSISLMLMMRALLRQQGDLCGLMTITSTSQFTPRLEEPVYTCANAGEYQFTYSMSIDPRIGQIMVAAPSGTDTAFWDPMGEEKDRSKLMSAARCAWLAFELWTQQEERFVFATINRITDDATPMKMILEPVLSSPVHQSV